MANLTLLDCIKRLGTHNLKGRSFVDSSLDGAVYVVLKNPRIQYGRFSSTKARIWIQYSGEKTPQFPSVKQHYNDIERE